MNRENPNRMSRPIRITTIAVAIGVLCAGLGGCISDPNTSFTKVSQDTAGGTPLRYYGGPKSPMWPDR